MTSGRAFVDKKLGEKVKRGKGERGESFYKAIFSFSPMGGGRKKARTPGTPGTLVWN
jgi:hypothetical protein